jgi:hypothetical protein
MSEQNAKHSLADMLRHPLANIVVGFLLTGGALTNDFTRQRTQEAHMQAQLDAREEAITGLASLNAEQAARAEQLLKAIQSGSSKEDVAKLADLYEAASIRWPSVSG